MGLAKDMYLIFHPDNATNIACTTRLLDMVPVWLGDILDKFNNKNKDSYWNLSISNSPKCLNNFKGDNNKLLLGIKCLNDNSERAFASTTMNIQRRKKLS